MRNRYPGQNKIARVDNYVVESLLPLPLVPADMSVPAPYVPGRGAPAHAGDYTFPGKSKILQMLAHRSCITKIMVLINKAVVKLP